MAKKNRGNKPSVVDNLRDIVNESKPKTPPPAKRTGPKEKYDTLNILGRLGKIEQWYREGKDDEQVATELGISVRTIYNWCNRAEGAESLEDEIEGVFGDMLNVPSTQASGNPEKYIPFVEARDRGKQPSNERLEKVTWDLAVGDFVHEKVAIGWDEGSATEHRYKEKLPPNIQLLKLLLQNRMPEKYRDTKDIIVTGGMNNTTRILGNYSDAELEALKGVAESAVQGGITPALIEEDDYISRDDDEDGDEDA